jgi:hypothetical protein
MVRRDTVTMLVWCLANLGVGVVFGALYMGHVSSNWRNVIGLSLTTINVALFMGGVGAVVVACAEWATVLREVLAGVNCVGTILLSKAIYNTVSPTKGCIWVWNGGGEMCLRGLCYSRSNLSIMPT